MALHVLQTSCDRVLQKPDRGSFWEPVLQPQDSCDHHIGVGAVGCHVNSGFFVDRNLRDQRQRERARRHRHCPRRSAAETADDAAYAAHAAAASAQAEKSLLSALGLEAGTQQQAGRTLASPMMLVLILTLLLLVLAAR